MALKFQERERLLNDDDDFWANRISITRNGSSTDLISNAFGSSGSSSFSGLSSAFGSELSSTETESEEEEEDDEFIAELTRKMADSTLEEDDEKVVDTPTEHHSEKLQSTISTGPTSVPKLPAFSDDHSRAVHVYNLENQPPVKHGGGTLSWAGRVKGTDLTQQVERKHQKPHNVQNRGKRAETGGGGGGFGSSAAAAWPTLQQSRQLQKQKPQLRSSSGSGMRAVFLGGSGSRNPTGSSGTGVFLPRAVSNGPDVRKKPECSTVLIPARVLQALQLHFEDMKSRSQSEGRASFASHPSRHDVAKAQDTSPAVDHNEMDLPQEWTY